MDGYWYGWKITTDRTLASRSFSACCCCANEACWAAIDSRACKVSRALWKYPLVNIQKTMENHHFQWENPLFLWWFSIAMLNYQRVLDFDDFEKSLCPLFRCHFLILSACCICCICACSCESKAACSALSMFSTRSCIALALPLFDQWSSKKKLQNMLAAV